MQILCLNGPNLNKLGERNPGLYGTISLIEIESELVNLGKQFGFDVFCFQSNGEGQLIDLIQEKASTSHGIIINAGALTHYGFSLRDALEDSSLPIVEIHLSNIYRREPWRSNSVIAPISVGQICGLGWRGYLCALQFFNYHLNKENQL